MAEIKMREMEKLFRNHKIKTRLIFYDSCVRSRLPYACPTWNLSQTQINRMNSVDTRLLRHLVRGGNERLDDYSYRFSNLDILRVTKRENLQYFIGKQQQKWLGHVVRMGNNRTVKKIIFDAEISCKRGRKVPTFRKQVAKFSEIEECQLF